MMLTQRQQAIIEIVKANEPITGEAIADRLSVTRAALRSDLSILTMAGFLTAKPRVGYCFSRQNGESDSFKAVVRYRVRDIHSRPVVVKEDSTAYDAFVTLFTEDAGTLIVVDANGYLAGVVSRKDLLKATMGNSDVRQIPVSVIMTRMPNIVYVHEDDSVLKALSCIVEHEVDSLPVVKDAADGQHLEVAGRISKTNMVRLMLDMAMEGQTVEVAQNE